MARRARRGESGAGGGASGDLFVVTRVEPSKLFQRRDADLVVEVPVTYAEAALGATVEVPTPYGDRVSLKVPPGTQEGRQLRIRGHGAPKLKGTGKGDLIARLRVTVPKKLTKKEREAEEAAARVAAEAKAAEEAKAAAAAAAAAKPAVAKPAAAKPAGTLHRPAAKPGEKREKTTKKAPGQVFEEEAAKAEQLGFGAIEHGLEGAARGGPVAFELSRLRSE